MDLKDLIIACSLVLILVWGELILWEVSAIRHQIDEIQTTLNGCSCDETQLPVYEEYIAPLETVA